MAVSEIIPANERQRMAAVRRYDILDTPADGEFDRITAMAARRFDVPIAIISIVDEDRIWFKSAHGVEARQIGRDPGLCASAILQDCPYILTDAKADVRSLANPLVAGDFGLRFYAGVPLKTSDGFNLGTLCVIDREPRPIDQKQIDDLTDLASVVMDQLEFRLSARRALSQANILAREIDHRVMNSLQFVSAMLQLQRRTAQHPEVSAQLTLAGNRVAAVARVHRHFHVDPSISSTPARGFLQRLCADLSTILEVRINVEGDDGLLPTTAIQPLGLLTNELATNAAKHGAGNITVTFSSGDICTLVVCDEGEGVPEGFDPMTNSTGLGMKVVETLVQQLHGSLSVGVNPAGRGACFTVAFPRAQAYH